MLVRGTYFKNYECNSFRLCAGSISKAANNEESPFVALPGLAFLCCLDSFAHGWLGKVSMQCRKDRVDRISNTQIILFSNDHTFGKPLFFLCEILILKAGGLHIISFRIILDKTQQPIAKKCVSALTQYGISYI